MGRKKANQFNWVVVAAAAVIEVIALLLLVPPFGVAGAGWSLVIAYGAMFALMLWREHRVFPVPYAWGRIARIPVILTLALAATYLLPDHGTGALALRIAVAAASARTSSPTSSATPSGPPAPARADFLT